MGVRVTLALPVGRMGAKQAVEQAALRAHHHDAGHVVGHVADGQPGHVPQGGQRGADLGQRARRPVAVGVPGGHGAAEQRPQHCRERQKKKAPSARPRRDTVIFHAPGGSRRRSGGAGAAHDDMDGDGTYACTAGDLGKGDFAMLNDKPCRIVETSVSKTGKHGHAKKKFTGVHVFTKAKVEDSQSTSHGMRKFDLHKVTYTVVSLDGDALPAARRGDVRPSEPAGGRPGAEGAPCTTCGGRPARLRGARGAVQVRGRLRFRLRRGPAGGQAGPARRRADGDASSR